jgi:hypothetical protein
MFVTIDCDEKELRKEFDWIVGIVLQLMSRNVA